MEILNNIRKSQWWKTAAETHDRHYPEHVDISIADHCESVYRSLSVLLNTYESNNAEAFRYSAKLGRALEANSLSKEWIRTILAPVALLHDIGKPLEDKKKELTHPLTGKIKAKRHPLLGVQAALEILPKNLGSRDTIVALIEEHDTPFSWYRQFQATNQMPGCKAYGKLDRKILGERKGCGIFLLSLFKMADTDGHENIQDVIWFIKQANELFLSGINIHIPLPTEEDLRNIDKFSGDR